VPEPADATPLKELLFETVESIEELLVLVWFHDRGEGSDGDSEGAARDTGLSADAAEVALRSLAARGLLSSSSGSPKRFLYAPSSALRDALHEIVLEYRANPVQVMSLMTANAIERVRTSALRTFAECFRIRGPGGG
jgi:hypothetical protein